MTFININLVITPAPSDHVSNFKKVGAIPSEPESLIPIQVIDYVCLKSLTFNECSTNWPTIYLELPVCKKIKITERIKVWGCLSPHHITILFYLTNA